MYLLQRIPRTIRGGPRSAELYERTSSDHLSYDTYFAAFPASYWRSLTTVRNVTLSCVLEGGGSAELVALHAGAEHLVESMNNVSGRISFQPVDLIQSDADALFLRLRGCRLITGEWSTATAPTREVRMMGVITTFNRQEYVTKTLEVLRELSTEVESVRNDFRLCVVDNARNLDVSTGGLLSLEVILNPNLGGAGGFTRGLMAARDGGWATHVLFMDDDVTLEPDAVLRTLAFLRYASDSLSCVHGAMISEDQPWLCIEAGADYLWKSIYPPRPLHHLEDLRDRQLALAARHDRPYAYSAWWYTAFPLALTKDNPLPVFIRGDDVAWGIMHTRGHIQTLPGVAVWHADFDVKNVPAAVYYEIRNLSLANLLAVPGYRWWHLLKRFLGYAFLNLYSMRYLSTEYLLRGMNDFLNGPKAWSEINPEALHRDLYSRAEEKSSELPAEVEDIPMDPASERATTSRDFLLSLVTFGGNGIPTPLRRSGMTAVPVQKRAIGAAIRHDTIVHRHPRQSVGFVAQRDQRRFWTLLVQVLAMACKIPFVYGATARKYRAGYADMVSDSAWKRRFENV